MNYNESAFQYADLIIRHLQGGLTSQEQEQLNQWLAHDKRNVAFLESIRNESQLNEQLQFFSELDRKAAWNKIIRQQSRRSGLYRIISWKAVAAVFLVAVCAAVAYLDISAPVKKKAAAVASRGKFMNDIPAGGLKASLRLSDGSILALEKLADGEVSRAPGIKVSRKEGQIVYRAASAKGGVAGYNTVSTPRGGEYKVLLPDGSKVWLNSSSTLRYPTSFNGAEREVRLTGEAYFEVARNRKKPFHVIAGDVDVKVLGTHFNVKAYSEEQSVRTTLLEGSVKVSRGNTSRMLMPGQESLIMKTVENTVDLRPAGQAKKFVVLDANPDDAVAWKNGEFSFNNEGLQEIMKQLSRWYDAEISYGEVIPDVHFTGKVSRYSNISKILNYLELTGGVHFKIEGRKVFVTE